MIEQSNIFVSDSYLLDDNYNIVMPFVLSHTLEGHFLLTNCSYKESTVVLTLII